jgi:hypothetical protein
VDNAAYHNVQLSPAPTSSSRKRAMIDWLSDRGIPFSDRMWKPELYCLTKLRKLRFKTFKIDALLAEHGHSVLRSTPYHSDLIPIEVICSSVKEYVARKNVSWDDDEDDAIKLAEKSPISSQRKNGARGATVPVSTNKITCGWNILLTTFQNKL